MKKFDIDEVKAFIDKQSKETKIYIGADSYRFKTDRDEQGKPLKQSQWYARYTTVVVVHINGKNGCRVFGTIDTERDYDAKHSRPFLRMMNEVRRSVDMYLQLAEVIGDRAISLHIDINPDEKHGSNVAYQAAIGYVKSMTGIDAVAKPNAHASSFAADHFRHYREEPVE